MNRLRGRRNTEPPPPPPACDCAGRIAELQLVVASLCRLVNSRTGGMPGIPGLIGDAKAVTEYARR